MSELAIKPVYKSWSFYRVVPLYLLAAYVIYKGHTPEQVMEVYETVTDSVTTYKDMLTTLGALLVPAVDNMFYARQRKTVVLQAMQK